eukprot:PhF_6_TR43396/c3_g1_i4/m.66630
MNRANSSVKLNSSFLNNSFAASQSLIVSSLPPNLSAIVEALLVSISEQDPLEMSFSLLTANMSDLHIKMIFAELWHGVRRACADESSSTMAASKSENLKSDAKSGGKKKTSTTTAGSPRNATPSVVAAEANCTTPSNVLPNEAYALRTFLTTFVHKNTTPAAIPAQDIRAALVEADTHRHIIMGTLKLLCEASKFFSRAVFTMKSTFIPIEDSHSVLALATLQWNNEERNTLIKEVTEKCQASVSAVCLWKVLTMCCSPLSATTPTVFSSDILHKSYEKILPLISTNRSAMQCVTLMVNIMCQQRIITVEDIELLLNTLQPMPIDSLQFPAVLIVALAGIGKLALSHVEKWGKALVDLVNEAIRRAGSGVISHGRTEVWVVWLCILRAVQVGCSCGAVATGTAYVPTLLSVLTSCPTTQAAIAAEIVRTWWHLRFYESLGEMIHRALDIAAKDPPGVPVLQLLESLAAVPGQPNGTPWPVDDLWIDALHTTLRRRKAPYEEALRCVRALQLLFEIAERHYGGSMICFLHMPHAQRNHVFDNVVEWCTDGNPQSASAEVIEIICQNSGAFPQQTIQTLFHSLATSSNPFLRDQVLIRALCHLSVSELVDAELWKTTICNVALGDTTILKLSLTIPQSALDVGMIRTILRRARSYLQAEENHPLETLTKAVKRIIHVLEQPTWNIVLESLLRDIILKVLSREAATDEDLRHMFDLLVTLIRKNETVCRSNHKSLVSTANIVALMIHGDLTYQGYCVFLAQVENQSADLLPWWNSVPSWTPSQRPWGPLLFSAVVTETHLVHMIYPRKLILRTHLAPEFFHAFSVLEGFVADRGDNDSIFSPNGSYIDHVVLVLEYIRRLQWSPLPIAETAEWFEGVLTKEPPQSPTSPRMKQQIQQQPFSVMLAQTLRLVEHPRVWRNALLNKLRKVFPEDNL